MKCFSRNPAQVIRLNYQSVNWGFTPKGQRLIRAEGPLLPRKNVVIFVAFCSVTPLCHFTDLENIYFA